MRNCSDSVVGKRQAAVCGRGWTVTTFEYVSVLLSIVVSLAFTHLIAGAIRLFQARGTTFSFVYAGWFVLLLFWCVDYWFSLWQARNLDVWTLGFVSFLLLMATVLYAACGLAVPTEAEAAEGVDLAAFHATCRRRYLGVLFLYQLLSIAGNLAIAPLQAAAVVNVGQIALIAAAWFWGGRRVQVAAVVLTCLLTGWYAFRFIPAL